MTATEGTDTSSIAVEAATMGLYITIALIATLVATSGYEEHGWGLFGLIWGATLGLSVAHLVAFRIAVGAAEGHGFAEHDSLVSLAQLASSAAVAATASLPIVLLPAEHETEGVMVVLVTLLGLSGYQAGRSARASRGRRLLIAATVASVGSIAAIFKFVLTAH